MKRFDLARVAKVAMVLASLVTTSSAYAASQFVAQPFVVADSSDTTDYQARYVSSPATAIAIMQNATHAPQGTYAGVLIASPGAHQSFDNLSFAYTGSETARVTVHYRLRNRSAMRFSSVIAKSGIISNKGSDGFQTVSLDARDFGINGRGEIDKVVISTDTSSGTDSFLVKNIKINQVAVSSDFKEGSKFYQVADGNSGPLENVSNLSAITHAVVSAGAANVNIINSLPATPKYSPQLILLQNYGSNTITLTDVTTPSSPTAITLTALTGGGINGGISYFYLPTGHTAQYAGYSSTTPFQVSMYCPVSFSNNSPTNPAITAYCESGRGTTLVETDLTNGSGDVVDISEVNGVNARWQIGLPCGGWVSGDYKSPSNVEIPVKTVKNNPGAAATGYVGDYGNPGVYPFGCTNCASRYNGGVFAAGCSGLVNYPPLDVGCDNAINNYFPPANTNPTRATHPPSGVHALPVDSYAPGGHIYNLKKLKPVPPEGYGICQLQRSSGCIGGTITITLLRYPFQ